jgi:glycosyltransferase involved in cell wall biosynthesis
MSLSMSTSPPSQRIVFWGTYDKGKPRNRILIQGLRENGFEVLECHYSLWEGIEDKSRLRTHRARLGHALRWISSYPRLLWRYLRLPAHDLVLVGYLGQLDVLVLRPFTWLRGVPLVWDIFLSLHDTVVGDRALLKPHHCLAYLLYAWEWLALRAPDLLLVDTHAHGRFFAQRFGVEPDRIARVLVGAEPKAFFPKQTDNERLHHAGCPYRVLFYGQFIPLHGMDVIARAIQLCAGKAIRWEVIGDGQDTERFRALLNQQSGHDLDWTPWVPYEELIDRIHGVDLCLGIFGTSDKACRVIPNKVFQVLAAGRALVTSDTPAVHELLEPGPGIILVPPGDPESLVAAICEMRRRDPLAAKAQLDIYRQRITPVAVVAELTSVLLGLSPEGGKERAK